jgi:hypothetical protein
MWVGQPTHSIIKLEIYMPRFKKADKVQRTDELVIGQWMNDSRLAHVREDGVKVFIHPHEELGSVAKRFKNIHALAEAGHADLDDPVSVQVTLKGMTSEDNIRHLEAIARIIQSHVDSAKKVQALKEVPVEIREATIKAIDSFQDFLQAENG